MTEVPRLGPGAEPARRRPLSLRLAAVARPLLEGRGQAGTGESPAVLRQGLDAGAAQVVFLATRDLPGEAMEGALSADERARWKRFTNPAAAHRFLAGRWLLRSVLAAVIEVAPAEVRLKYGEHGKPTLTELPAGGLAFNLSHSGDLAAVALTREGRVGIDVESMRPLSDIPRLARRILTPDEAASFKSLPANARHPSLIAAWTRKEAVLKALGTGISGSPSSVAISLDPMLEGSDFVAVAAGVLPEQWAVRVLAMPPGYQGALAIEGAGRSVVTWQALAITPDR